MEYGFDLINFDGVEVPTFTFGGGNIRVTSGWEDGDGLDGVLFSLAPDNTEIGTVIDPHLEGKKFTDIPNLKCYMRFDKVESIDVIIERLMEVRKKLQPGKLSEL